jgi:hypothetical protein
MTILTEINMENEKLFSSIYPLEIIHLTMVSFAVGVGFLLKQ